MGNDKRELSTATDGLFVAISSDGELTGAEMLRELSEYKICPVLCFEEKGQNIVPVFKASATALKFAKRNTTRDCAIGVMETAPADRKKLEDDGFVVQLLEWPNKRTCRVHVLTVEQEVSTRNAGYRKGMKF